MEELDRRVRYEVYHRFAESAAAPSAQQLAEALGQGRSAIEESLRRLTDTHALALAPGTTNIWMASPFSAVPTPYPVETRERTYWAPCAWDSLAIPGLLGVDSTTRALCPDCGAMLSFEIRDGRPVPDHLVVHFAVPARDFWENVGFT